MQRRSQAGEGFPPSRKGQNHAFKDRKLGMIYYQVVLDILPDLAHVQDLDGQHPETTYFPQQATNISVCCKRRFNPDGEQSKNGPLMVLIFSEYFSPKEHDMECKFDAWMVTPTLGRSTQYLLAVDLQKIESFKDKAGVKIWKQCRTDEELAEAGDAEIKKYFEIEILIL